MADILHKQYVVAKMELEAQYMEQKSKMIITIAQEMPWVNIMAFT
jgi:hypothetical protein